MGNGATLVTRNQYTEMLIDDSFRDAAEMESGFLVWVQHHTPIWRGLGHSEVWIRQRIEAAQITRGVHRRLKDQGLTMLEIRVELRKSYGDYPHLYDLAKEAHPNLLRYRGDAWDLRQRYTLRVLLFETDKRAHEQFCRWSGYPVPGPEAVFFEQPDDVRVIRDLSTVEDLELMLAMCRSLLQLFETQERLANKQIAARMDACGQQLRAAFISKHGYQPEDSATPYIPVTVDGPQDHEEYYAKEYPELS